MQLLNLELEGFGRFSGTKTIDFKDGLNFIYGMNESGKSTILEGIMASIFKYTPTQIEPLYCWTNCDVCKAILTYKNDEGEIFRITSDYKNNRRKLDKFTNDLFVEISSVEKNVAPYIKQHFGFDDRKVFENTSFIKQSQMAILEDTATKSKIKDMIEEVLTGRSEVTATKTIAKLKKVAKTASSDIFEQERKREELEIDLKNAIEINSRISTQSTNHEKISKDLEEKTKLLEKLGKNKELFDKKESLLGQKKNVTEHINIIDVFITKLKEKQSEPVVTRERHEPVIVQERKALLIILLLVGICISIGSVALSFLIGLIFGIPLVIYGVYKLIQKKQQLQKPAGPKSIESQYDEQKKDFIDKIAGEIAQYEGEKRGLINQLAVLDSRLEDYKLVNFTIDDFNGLEEIKKQVEGLKEQKIELKTSVSTTTSLVESPEEVQEKLDALNEKIEELQNKFQEYGFAANFLELAQTQVQKKFTPIIEKDSKHILKEVTDNRYEDIRINEETLDISLIAPEINEYVDVYVLSQGTRDQIYFALRTVLTNLLCGNLNMPLILDDPFHNFDETRLEKTIKAIKNISREKQIILISHRPYHNEFEKFATNVIELK